MIWALRSYCKIVKREFLALKSIIVIIIIILIVAEVFKLEDEDVFIRQVKFQRVI